MPELPEVETMVSSLRGVLLGRSLKKVKINEAGVLRNTSARALSLLKGSRLVGLSRRGKFLILHLSSGTQLVFHLKMTGRLVLAGCNDPPGPWERLHLEFSGWDRKVLFEDQRKFGYLAVVPEGNNCPVPLMYELGPDALQVSRKQMTDILQGSRRPVKALLLDQRSIAGLGNIYVDECLHRAGIHPLHPAGTLSPEEAAGLHRAMRRVLKRAIECGGSSVRSFLYSWGQPGTFQKYHRVYGRKGERCRRCHGTVAYGKVASRGTHFCPDCQRLPESKKTSKARKG